MLNTIWRILGFVVTDQDFFIGAYHTWVTEKDLYPQRGMEETRAAYASDLGVRLERLDAWMRGTKTPTPLAMLLLPKRMKAQSNCANLHSLFSPPNPAPRHWWQDFGTTIMDETWVDWAAEDWQSQHQLLVERLLAKHPELADELQAEMADFDLSAIYGDIREQAIEREWLRKYENVNDRLLLWNLMFGISMLLVAAPLIRLNFLLETNALRINDLGLLLAFSLGVAGLVFGYLRINRDEKQLRVVYEQHPKRSGVSNS